MSNAILELCVLSVVCGAVLSFTPEGGTKAVMRLLCTAALICSILQPLMDFDFDSFTENVSYIQDTEDSFSKTVTASTEKIKCSVIEENCREYILDKAENLGVNISELKLNVYISDGLILPYSAEISGKGSDEKIKELSSHIQDELGIPKERQTWSCD